MEVLVQRGFYFLTRLSGGRPWLVKRSSCSNRLQSEPRLIQCQDKPSSTFQDGHCRCENEHRGRGRRLDHLGELIFETLV